MQIRLHRFAISPLAAVRPLATAAAMAAGLVLGWLSAAAAQVITEFTVPTTVTSSPWEITAGPDSALWFTERFANKIGRIDTAGNISEFAIPTLESFPEGITVGPDGNLWFAETSGNRVGRITTAGVITEFTLPVAGRDPQDITAGPAADGALWFTERDANRIGRITTAGVVTNEFVIPTTGVRLITE
jgi:virginiamycin B lyase